MLDPQAQALMTLLSEKGIPPVYTQTPVEARASYLARRSFTQPDAPEVGRVQNLHFSHSGVDIAVRVYHPPGATQAMPALVYLHGGGWTVGDLDSHDVLCRSLCQQSGGVVVAVDYRMGPEHKFPAAYDDAVAVWQWVAAQAQTLGIDPARIAIGGDSAGGQLGRSSLFGLA